MTRKTINILYKKCFAFTVVKQKNAPADNNSLASLINFSCAPDQPNKTKRVTEVLWKDTLSEQKAYICFLQKLAETYENMLCKAQFFRRFTKMIFQKVPTFRFLSDDGLIKGFFFLFVYKDFIIREITQRVSDQLQQVHHKHILAQIQNDYQTFMESDLTCWVNIMLQCQIFESYQSIVTPNESM